MTTDQPNDAAPSDIDRTPLTDFWAQAGRRWQADYRSAVLGWVDRYDRSTLGRGDVLGALPVFARTAFGLMAQPLAASKVIADWSLGLAESFGSTLGVAAGAAGGSEPGPERPRDRRFVDPSWSSNPYFFWLREQYGRWEKAVGELIDAADLPETERRKARFLAQTFVDALAPSNFAATNPAVQKRALETGGASLVRGWQNFVDDVQNNGGQPRQVAEGVYEVGRNLAVTPGKVVFRNELMELLQYEPQTEHVYEVPLLFSPPWINKYYIMDLAPGRSLVEWAVQHGHTVFVISYRNPDESMREVRMDDYLLSGPRAALDVVTEITGSDKVNLLGLCLGGTLTMATLAYLEAVGDDRINNATFLNTLIDFTEPGALGVTTDEKTLDKLDVVMQQTGFLPAANMSRTFDLLRANDLIWNYVVSNWLLGDAPAAFDILTWNADSTRMPANMHSFYLRHCYVKNELAQGAMELAGTELDLSKVHQDLYFLAAEADHIVPWRSSYAGARLPSGKVRFVLSNSGHIAGIVNPPSPKSKHWTSQAEVLPESPDEWLAGAQMLPTTWWEDWTSWIGQRAGEQRTPPPMGSDRHPPLADAPGTFVLSE